MCHHVPHELYTFNTYNNDHKDEALFFKVKKVNSGQIKSNSTYKLNDLMKQRQTKTNHNSQPAKESN